MRSHHGSLAREARSEVEDLLKAGRIRALVATSSLELGIDMGAIDLVVQIEAPPSVASGLQRIGRAGHQVGAASEGVIFPKFRGDLVACAAVARAMHEGKVESTRYPRNPLDVLAQQLVAMAGLDTWDVDELYRLVRRAAPFADLGRRMFDGVLDMLSGRYPSDEFAELRPRVTWDRVKNTVTGREGAVRVAIANAGTIPDRGLYGVFLAGAERPTRVGELDEEMVFETEVGDTFTLGASTWRIEDITHDRVLVSPAPGEPGKMPFWHGDQAGRPVELGLAIGKLVRELGDTPKPAAIARLTEHHGLDRLAAENLLQYLDEQAAAGGVPDDRTIVIERCLDELGDWRVCVLSPLGSRIHAPWAMAVTALVRSRTGVDVEVMWGDEGFVVRFPETEQPPDPELMLPDPDEIEGLVLRQLGSTSLFAARFRETAARALLLPRRRAGQRTPLFLQRKRASDLLAVAVALRIVSRRARDLSRGAARSLRHARPGGRAAAGGHARPPRHHHRLEAAVAVRGLAALQLRRQLHLRRRRAAGGAPGAGAVGRSGAAARAPRRRRAARPARSGCARRARAAPAAPRRRLQGAQRRRHPRSPDSHRRSHPRRDRRAIGVCRRRRRGGRARAGTARGAAAGRRRAALRRGRGRGALPRCARRTAAAGTARSAARAGARRGRRSGHALRPLARPVHGGAARGPLRARRGGGRRRCCSGSPRPDGSSKASSALAAPSASGWTPNVLRSLRRRSLAKLRHEIEAVDADALGRFMVAWHGVGSKRRGLEALLDAIEQLQGAAMPASVLERDILAARVADYSPAMLDTLMAAGEVVWVGIERLGERDGRIALYLTDHLTRLRPPVAAPPGARRTGGGRARLPRGARRVVLCRHPRGHRTRLSHRHGRGAVGAGVDGARDERHAAPAAQLLRPHRGAAGAASLAGAVPLAPQLAAELGRPLVARRERGGVAIRQHRMGGRDGAAAAHAVRSGHARDRRARKPSPAASAPCTRCCGPWRTPGASAAATSSPASAARSSPCPPRSTCSDRTASAPDTPQAVVLAATDPANPYGTLLKWPEAGGGADDGPRRRRARRDAHRGLAGRARRRPRRRLPAARRTRPARVAARRPSRRAPASPRRWRARSSSTPRHARTAGAACFSRPSTARARRPAPGGAVVRGRGLRHWAPTACSTARRGRRRCRPPITAGGSTMPEGDTIHRAARALHAALAGQRVERFESVFAAPDARGRRPADRGPARRARRGARQAPADVDRGRSRCCGPTCACTARGTSTGPANAGSGRGTSCAS